MADITALKNRIRAAIKANDNQEITGPVLQQALLDIVDELNGATETEASQRQSGDSTLQQGINTERQARIDADNALGQRITDKINSINASNVTYNHSDSKLDATNVQQAVDEVSSIGHFAKRGGIVNISTNYNSTNTAETLTLEQAIAKVPSSDRVLGFRMTFLSPDGWVEYQYSGDSITKWNDINYWNNYVNSTMVSQEIGDSESKVMSQRALQDSLGLIYPEFSASQNYRAGYVVSYNGHLYEFTEEYIGEWNNSKVKPFTPNSKYSKVPYHSLYKAQNSVTTKVDRAIKELWLSPNIPISDRNNIILGNVAKEETTLSGTDIWRISLYDGSKETITNIEDFRSKKKENSLEIIKGNKGSYALIDWRELPVGSIVASIDHIYKVDIDYVSDINNFPILREYIKTENYDEVSAYAKKVYYHSILAKNSGLSDRINSIVKELYIAPDSAGIKFVSDLCLGNIQKGTTASDTEWRIQLFDTTKEAITPIEVFISKSNNNGLEIIKSNRSNSCIVVDWSGVKDKEQVVAVVDPQYNIDADYVTNLDNFPIIKQYLYNKDNDDSNKEFEEKIDKKIDKKTGKVLYHSVYKNENATTIKVDRAIKELWLSPNIKISDRNDIILGNVAKKATTSSGTDIWRISLYDGSKETITNIEDFLSEKKENSLEIIKGNKGSYALIDWRELPVGMTVASVDHIYKVDAGYVSDINNFPIIKQYLDLQNFKPQADITGLFEKHFNTPAISWVDDDFNLTSVPKIKAICDEVGCKCDFALTPQSTGGTNLDYNAVYNISEEALTLAKSYELEGFHIEIHPPHYGWYPSATMGGNYSGRKWVENSLVKTIRIFKEKGLLNSSCIIYPGSSGGNAEAIDMASCHVEYGINAGGSSDYNDGVHNKFSLNRLFISFTSSHTKTWYKRVIDEAVSKGAWLILGTHGHEFNDSGTVDETSKSLANLKEVIQYANEKCAISPISQVFKKRKPMLDLYLST